MFNRKSFLVAAIAAAAVTSSTQAALTSPGDLQFSTFNPDEDGWALAALVDIDANTTVYFSDNEYVSGAFNSGESYHKWVSGGASIPAGTVVRFSRIDSATLLGASFGTLTRESVSGNTNYGISATADTVYAYLGTGPTTPSSFLAAAVNGTDGGLAGTGLAFGTNAIQVTASSDFAEYTGPRNTETSFAAYLPFLSNPANWNIAGDGTFDTVVPNLTSFSIVPEPASLGLIAAAGVFGMRRRRGV